jgi:hypothetical protein
MFWLTFDPIFSQSYEIHPLLLKCRNMDLYYCYSSYNYHENARIFYCQNFQHLNFPKIQLKNSVALVRKRTIPIERQPLVDEVPTFAVRGYYVVSATDPHGC